MLVIRGRSVSTHRKVVAEGGRVACCRREGVGVGVVCQEEVLQGVDIHPLPYTGNSKTSKFQRLNALRYLTL